jgi:cytochrome b subunit of formate dehydrogenase
MDNQTKLDTQRDVIDDLRTENQRLNDRMELLDEADIKNFEQHKQILDKIQAIADTLKPISETYTSAGKMMKWFMALLVFLSVLAGTVIAWSQIFNKK